MKATAAQGMNIEWLSSANNGYSLRVGEVTHSAPRQVAAAQLRAGEAFALGPYMAKERKPRRIRLDNSRPRNACFG